MAIYTKVGDRGETGLFNGKRVSKDHARIEAYGTVDELNAAIGLVRCEDLPKAMDDVLERVQRELFAVGADLASPDAKRATTPEIEACHVSACERDIDRFDDNLPPLKQFILPGGVRSSALLHVARTVCRRAERRVVHLASLSKEGLSKEGLSKEGLSKEGLSKEGLSKEDLSKERVSPEVIIYLNRLGDLLFVLARAANAAAGQGDVHWDTSRGR